VSRPDPRSIPSSSAMAMRWASRRTFGPEQLAEPLALAEAKRAQGLTISVGVLGTHDSRLVAARDAITSRLTREIDLVDEVIALRSGPLIAPLAPVSAAGARGLGMVVDPADVMPEIPWTGARGDAMWRGLTTLRGDIVVWVDGDDLGSTPDTVARLAAPLLMNTSIGFVKGYGGSNEEIEIEIGGVVYLAGGARLTDLLVRPLLSIFFSELAGIFRPFRGSCAGRADVLRRIPFMSGCSVDIAMLIDILELIGLEGLAQVDLGTRSPNARPLDELGPEAHAIARTILNRAAQLNRIDLAPSVDAHPLLTRAGRSVLPERVDEIERPPVEILPPYLAALSSAGPNGDGDRSVRRREHS
jgi:glucosyl-3-phosphoglycerate synthase